MDFADIKIPQGSFKISPGHNKISLLVAGGRKPKNKWLQNIKAENYVYAVDKGLDYCLEAGFFPNELYGDRDSAKAENWLKAEKEVIVCKAFPPAKDDTDLQLLLKDLPGKQILIATGIWGGRADHLYANIFSLLAYKQEKKAQVVLADQQEVMILLETGEEASFIFKNKPLAISLLPFEDSNNVSITGVKWPLAKDILRKNKPYAISNELLDNIVTVGCHSGCIGFYINFESGD